MHPPLWPFHLDHTFYGRIAGGLRGTLIVNSLYTIHTAYPGPWSPPEPRTTCVSSPRFETTNGIKHEEAGRIYSGLLPETGAMSTEGRVRWHDPSGMKIIMYWYADENGYQPLVSTE